MKKSVLSLAVLMTLATTHAMAATTDLTVTGTITPAACTPTLSNGGLVEYGSLALTDLEENPTNYKLPAKSLNFSIECSAPATFALIANDNRRDSSPADAWLFGLGKHQDQLIGYYGMTWQYESTVVDGAQGSNLLSEDGGNSWNDIIDGILQDAGRKPNALTGFSTGTNLGPTPATSVNVTMDVRGTINKGLTLNGAMKLDGSATIEVVYL
ncbi:DUF1120 domain-containing protein [Pseudomonas sp. BIGb0427]|uniref:DUF1120 domain-containing protein n=1 Tax=unclassified Pseudomonas TaxID=196821 RepID=UPI00168EA001|nr:MULTISPECIES: DUF1120 domain-containing protein [unclassified Pseudomonas]NLU59794.1 DUF1120 domain-containing protein [Pseudomonas sp. BIGb0427]QPG60716.1 DUF1120 domain-containing protein [Pseudomonas sp. BIGb0427]UVM68327.1 DUF1120 domain-containing protein [Pseudomonas sp. B21-009]